MTRDADSLNTTVKRGDFGRILERIKPAGVSWAAIQRAVGVGGPHFYGILAGERDGKPARPSPELVAKFIDVFCSLGVSVSDDDAQSMMSIAAKLPDGFAVVKEDAIRSNELAVELEAADPWDRLITMAAYNHDDDGLSEEEKRSIKMQTMAYVDGLFDGRKKSKDN